jgi:hypothetical protein
MIQIRTGSAPKIEKQQPGVGMPPPRPPIGGVTPPGMASAPAPAQAAFSMVAAADKPKKRRLTTGQGHATSMAPAPGNLPPSPFGQQPAPGGAPQAPAAFPVRASPSAATHRSPSRAPRAAARTRAPATTIC